MSLGINFLGAGKSGAAAEFACLDFFFDMEHLGNTRKRRKRGLYSAVIEVLAFMVFMVGLQSRTAGYIDLERIASVLSEKFPAAFQGGLLLGRGGPGVESGHDAASESARETSQKIWISDRAFGTTTMRQPSTITMQKSSNALAPRSRACR